MKTLRSLSLFSAAFLALAAGRASAAAPSASSAPDVPDTKRVDAAKDSPELLLKRGMAADEVKKIMGKPDAVRPMPVQTGTAEVWSYTRRIPGTTETIMVGSPPVTTTVLGPNGTTSTQTIGSDPVPRTVHHVTIETVELLMFNKHFLEKKITREEKTEFS